MPPNLFATLPPGDWADGDVTVWEDKELDEHFPIDFAFAQCWAKTNGSHTEAVGDVSQPLLTLRDPRVEEISTSAAPLDQAVEFKGVPSIVQHDPVTEAHRRPPSMSKRAIVPAPAPPALASSSANTPLHKPLPSTTRAPSAALGPIKTGRQPPELPSQEEHASVQPDVAPPVDSVYVGGRPHVLRQGQRSELVLVPAAIPAPRGMFPAAAPL